LIEYLAAVSAPARVFEIGEIFAREQERIVERTALAFGFSAAPGGEPPWRDSNFLRLKSDCEALLRAVTGREPEFARAVQSGFHAGKAARVELAGVEVGIAGCADPRLTKSHEIAGNVYLCLLDVGALPAYERPRYRTPSRYPSTYRDLALVVDADLPAQDLERAIAAALGPLCTGVAVFDEYRGPQVQEGRKSLAVRVTLQRFDATITDEEADAAIARVLDAVRERFAATIRS
jgi:phenylalanyl-tRNA synthetase beta chain